MRYFKYSEDSISDDGVTYVEEDAGCTLRQIIDSGEEFVASNLNHPKWGFVLAEKYVDYDESSEGVEFVAITQQEFDTVWNQHLANHNKHWEMVKAHYPVGTKVIGAIRIFYPQGVIIDLGSNALAVADYAQCHASARPEWMYPKHKVKATVAGYDEKNHWVKLLEPQVLAKTVK